jgi:uncharacterized protein YkwD
VLVVTLVTACLMGLVGVLLGTYVISGNQLAAAAGPSVAVPLSTSTGSGSATSATPEASLPDTVTAGATVASATTVTTTTRPATTRATRGTAATKTSSTAGAPTTAPKTSVSTTVTATSVGSSEQQVFALTNTQRIAAGCPALVWNDTLAAVARAHSADMAANNYFDHNNQAGLTPAQRVLAAGYSYTYTAENIAAGQPTASDAMTSWMNSAGHKANIINCDLHELGVGFATGGSYGTYWTQDFGTR